MSQPSPFTEEPNEIDKTTRILPGATINAASVRVSDPEPERRMVPSRAAPTQQRQSLESPEGSVWDLGALNPLCALAAPLLTMAARLAAGHMHPDLEELRSRAVTYVRDMEGHALQDGVSPERLRVLRYLICATLDDLVLSTAEGPQSDWASRGLVSTIEQETWGGERFFVFLDNAMTDPVRWIDVLELCHICISIGFAGRYRVAPRGSTELAALRDKLFRIIRAQRGDPELDLSPPLRPLDLPFMPTKPSRWLWAVPIAALLLLVTGWIVADRSLSATAAGLVMRLETILPPGQPLIIHPSVAPTSPAPTLTPEQRMPQIERLRERLADFVAAGRLEITENEAYIILRSPDLMLPSGRTAPPQEALVLIERIGAALALEPGEILVVGHSDNVPILARRPLDNAELSRRRAQMVAERMAPTIGGEGRMSVEGRGDKQPIASNDTPTGRQRNRRVEVLLSREGRLP